MLTVARGTARQKMVLAITQVTTNEVSGFGVDTVQSVLRLVRFLPHPRFGLPFNFFFALRKDTCESNSLVANHPRRNRPRKNFLFTRTPHSARQTAHLLRNFPYPPMPMRAG